MKSGELPKNYFVDVGWGSVAHGLGRRFSESPNLAMDRYFHDAGLRLLTTLSGNNGWTWWTLPLSTAQAVDA